MGSVPAVVVVSEAVVVDKMEKTTKSDTNSCATAATDRGSDCLRLRCGLECFFIIVFVFDFGSVQFSSVQLYRGL
jgi:hypothetical protein